MLRFAFITTFIFTIAGEASAQPLEPARDPHEGTVLDLCTLGTSSDGTSSVRQRALVFGPAGFERLDRDPTLAQTDAARHAREAFIAGLPLDRMYQVVTTIAPDPTWLSREWLSIAEISKFLLESSTPAVVGGADRGPQERALAAYSAGCADWLLVPVIDSASWSWQWFDPPTDKLALLHDAPLAPPDGTHPLMRGNAMMLPDIKLTGRVGAYHREGDRFVRVAVVSGGSTRDVGMPDYPPADWGTGVPNFLSAIPDASCMPGTPRDGTPGFQCQGVLDGNYVSKGKNEFSLGVCTARNLNNPEVWIACITRLEAEKVAGGAQRELRKVRGINLFDELRQHDGRPAIRLGRHEGVKVGYGFYVPDEHGGIGAYFKVTEAGPGGPNGEFDPSILRNRFGATPIGARVYEYPQSNLYLAPRIEGGVLAGMAAPTTITTGPLAGQYMINPDRLLRLDVSWRAHGAVELSTSERMQELGLRGDHYNALLLRVGLEIGR
ncbi:MAG TPA: hypothetical protein VLB44_11325 [Kofleriaceae bacterium]|nr:hypothetical protein [Kofleriaceae bacterium]